MEIIHACQCIQLQIIQFLDIFKMQPNHFSIKFKKIIFTEDIANQELQ